MARDLGWGDVRMVEFGGPHKTRPALVLTRGSAIPYLNAVTVAPVTRTIRGIPTEVALGVDEGLKAPSVANLDNLQTVRASRLGRYLGSISASRRAEVRDAVLFALGLEMA
jgi:mRNA interferase MazF